MKKINLKNLKVYTSLSKTDYKTDDSGREIVDENGNKFINYTIFENVHRQLADYLYNNAHGVGYLSLSIKLYNSDGEIELNEEEIEMLKSAFDGLKPSVIEALNERINEKTT